MTFERPDRSLNAAYTRISQRLVDLGAPRVPAALLLSAVHDRVEDTFRAHQSSGALEEIDLVGEAAAAYADLGISLHADQLDELLRLEQEAWWEGVRVEPDVVPALARLKAAGFRLGLCSNAPYRVQSMLDQLAHFGLARWFDAITFSGAVGWRKPSPLIFTAALEALATTAAKTVMVGDSPVEDIDGAHAAGLRGVLLTRQGTSRSEGRSAPDATVTSLDQMAEMLVAAAYNRRAGEGMVR